MKKILIMVIFISIMLVSCENLSLDETVDENIIDDIDGETESLDDMPINKYYNYYFLSNSDLDIILANDVTISSIETEIESFNESVYIFSNGVFTLNKEFLMNLNEGVYTINITTSSSLYKINLEIIDNRVPFLISNCVINYQSEININLLFELYGGSVVKLNGNNILESDYTVDGANVIISSSYIDNIVINDPLRETLIISYYLENKGYITIGYLFIEVN